MKISTLQLASFFLFATPALASGFTLNKDDPSVEPCDPNYDELETAWRRSWRAWKSNESNDCYDFTFERVTVAPELTGPFQVQVRDGVVVSHHPEKQIPTMDEMYKLVRNYCFMTCPEVKLADWCSANFAYEGGVAYVEIDFDENILDDEELFYMSDLKFCDE